MKMDDDGLPTVKSCCSLPSAQDQYPLNPVTLAARCGRSCVLEGHELKGGHVR